MMEKIKLNSIKQIIAIASGKGGVGKALIAVLKAAFAKRGRIFSRHCHLKNSSSTKNFC
jgi:Mrp family chromosome partitioning ATPase